MSNPYLEDTNDQPDDRYREEPMQIGYQRPEPKQRKRHGTTSAVLAMLVVIVLSVVAVFGVSMWLSVRSLMVDLSSAGSYIERLQTAVENLDAAEITWSSKNIAESINSAQEEVGTLPWNIAAGLPVLQEDVLVARQTLHIAAQLTNEALTPMATRYEMLTQALGNGTNALSPERIGANATAVADLARAVNDAGVVIKDCKNTADTIGKSHLSQLNDSVEKLRTLLNEADSVYQSLQGWVSGIQVVAEGVAAVAAG